MAIDRLGALLADIRITGPTVVVRDCRDTKDDKVMECVLAAGVDLIVSGD